MSGLAQKETIAKAIWHQFTTVVILKKNMRQNVQTENDAKLCKALENMRYAACKPDDIDYLHSRVAGRAKNQPDLSSPEFRFASIITSRNAQRDRLNELGSKRFADEIGSKLHAFHSYDTIGRIETPNPTHIKNRKQQSHISHQLSENMKEMLWNIVSSKTDHLPGVLYLCKGMPVMIKHNDATELSVTNGQEATVVHWESAQDDQGREYLETLFVKLKNPPRPVKIDGLPENIIPMSKTSVKTECICPNGKTITINCSQVQVILNFGMTDYNSQGRSCVANPVILSSSPSFHNYYTALSRSVSHAGTVIIGKFDPYIITKGINGRLRQEFRELELLAYITELKYNNNLPLDIKGTSRYDIICQFQKWKGQLYVPDSVPEQLVWSKYDPLEATDNTSHIKWSFAKSGVVDKVTHETQTQIKNNKKIENKKHEHFVTANGSVSLKRARENDDGLNIANKRQRMLTVENVSRSQPAGFIWDSHNYSCPYDAILSILFDIWIYKPQIWSRTFAELNPTAHKLVKFFLDATAKRCSLEQVRDNIRQVLYEADNQAVQCGSLSRNRFPYGASYADVHDVIDALINSPTSVSRLYINCSQCGQITQQPSQLCYSYEVSTHNQRTVAEFIKYSQTEKTTRTCPNCRKIQPVLKTFNDPPKVFIIKCMEGQTLLPTKTIKVLIGDGRQQVQMSLQGIIVTANSKQCHIKI